MLNVSLEIPVICSMSFRSKLFISVFRSSNPSKIVSSNFKSFKSKIDQVKFPFSFHVIDYEKYKFDDVSKKEKILSTIAWMGNVENVTRKGVDKSIFLFNQLHKLDNEFRMVIIGPLGKGSQLILEIIKENNLEVIELRVNYEQNQLIKNSIKNNLKTYVIEKIINSNIEKNDFDNLFIYQDIQEIGIFIKTEPNFESINIDNEHTILKIYFASENDFNTISMSIFDPFKEINISPILEEEFVEIEKNYYVEETPNDRNSINDLIDDNTIIKYLEEIYSISTQIDSKFLELENKLDDIELVKDIKRLVHTLKGNANFLGLFDIERNCNYIEDILFKISDEKEFLDENIFQKLFDYIDVIKNEIEQKIYDKNNTNLSKESNKSEVVKKNIIKKEKEYFVKRTDIRVDTEKLDKLFDLVGELITIESVLINSDEIKNINTPNFKKNSTMLNKIIREIQEVSMMIRM
ncbi:MAG: Hpt domain-containing protein, partial [Candidatus Sericytochromatia bacterium]